VRQDEIDQTVIAVVRGRLRALTPLKILEWNQTIGLASGPMSGDIADTTAVSGPAAQGWEQ